MTTATENYRINSQMAAMESTIQRIEFLAKNGGSIQGIARECERCQEFLLAVTSANSDDEIAELVSRANSV